MHQQTFVGKSILGLLFVFLIVVRTRFFCFFGCGGKTEESQKLRELVEADASDAAAAKFSMDEPDTGGEGETSTSIAKVYQRIRVEDGDADEIWALLEFEVQNLDLPDPEPPKRYKRWQKFETESALKDFIRRDTGEPLTLPPYSLSPNQSSKIEENARQSVSQVTEEFRRFRVRSEVQRKQADAQIRDLQSSNVRTAKRRIEGEDLVGFAQESLCCLSVVANGAKTRRKKSWNRPERIMRSWSSSRPKWRRKKRSGRRPTMS